MLRGQLWWAIVHDMSDRARLLVGHGVDFCTLLRDVAGGHPASRPDRMPAAHLPEAADDLRLAGWSPSDGIPQKG
jgi:hypothetical protein